MHLKQTNMVWICCAVFSKIWCGLSLCVFVKNEGPSARDLMAKFSTGKKTSKNKKKLEKAMKVLKVPLFYLPLKALFLIPVV